MSFYGRSVFFPSSLLVSLTFSGFRYLNSYPLDQVGSGKFFRGKVYDWQKKGILLMRINFLHSRPEAQRGASCTKTHFIHCLGSSRQAYIQSNATYPSPATCMFLNEIVNRERSESCYITLCCVQSSRTDKPVKQMRELIRDVATARENSDILVSLGTWRNSSSSSSPMAFETGFLLIFFTRPMSRLIRNLCCISSGEMCHTCASLKKFPDQLLQQSSESRMYGTFHRHVQWLC